MRKVRIAVIDGQGGGIGGAVIRELKKEFAEGVEIVALGTNSIATSVMLSAGANKGATGENAVVCTAGTADYIVGSVNIILANSMLGELTAKMAAAVSTARSRKILLPLTQEHVDIVGIRREPLPHLVRELCEQIRKTEEASDVRGECVHREK